MNTEILQILEAVKQGRISKSEALARITELRRGKKHAAPRAHAVDAARRECMLSRSFNYDEEYLKAHVVYGTQVVLGVTHCSLLLEAAFTFPESAKGFTLHKCLFMNPVVVGPGEEVRVDVMRERDDAGQFLATMFHPASGGADLEALGSEYRAHYPQQPQVDPRTFLDDPERIISRDDIAANPLLKRGPVLETVEEVYLRQGKSLARLTLTEYARSHAASYRVHPGLIDGGFIASVAGLSDEVLFPQKGNGFWVPFMIENIHVAGTLAEVSYCYSEVRQADRDTLVLDYHLCDRQGRSILSCIGFTLKYTAEKDFFKGSGSAIKEVNVAAHEKSAIAGKGLEERVGSYLVAKVASILGVPSHGVDPATNFMELGCDSNQLVRMSRQLEKELAIELYPTIFFEQQNINELSAYFTTHYAQQLHTFFPIETDEKSASPQLASREKKNVPVQDGTDGKAHYRENMARREKPGYIQDVSSIRMTDTTATRRKDIAIIGMSGRFAGSNDLHEFWEKIEKSHDMITEVPGDHWDWRPWFDADREAPHKTYCKWGSFIEVDTFDPTFFGITPREALWMDPQLRILLETVHATFEDAGYASKIAGTDTGVYVGACFRDYWEEILSKNVQLVDYQAGSRFLCSMPGRISYTFDLQGESIPVDNACASSLTALHLACKALEQERSGMALVAGVNLILNPVHYINFARSQALSPTGHCNPFDKDADGYVPGEGVGAVLLKPLDRAVRDNDHIYAVIKGSATNHVGHSNNPTSPRPELQAKLLKQAWQDAGIDPRTLGYIEAHGTGTSLGDPIEISALTQAFNAFTDEKHFCSIGSVKSNIGHLEGAAGIAGLIKAVLMLTHKKIPAMPTFKTLNPFIKLDESALRINTKPEKWKAEPGMPLRVGVSSFGMTGNNAHVVLESYDAPVATSLPHQGDGTCVCVLSAKTDERLKVHAAQLADYLQKEATLQLKDVAYTLQAGRKAMEERLAIVTASMEELVQALRHFGEGKLEIPGLFRGRAGRDAQVSGLLTQGREGRHYLEIIMQDRKYEKLASLWVLGVAIEWEHLYKGPRPNICSLPTYPFARERYWFDRDEYETYAAPSGQEKKETINLAEEKKEHRPAQLMEEDVVEYIVALFCRTLKLQPAQVDPAAGFESFGIDSLLITQLNRELEAIFGKLPAALFFNHNTINELAGYFITHHKDAFTSRAVNTVNKKAPRTPDVSVVREEQRMAITSGENEHDDIAIIGVSGRFPFAATIDEFWKNLAEGKDCITEIPVTRWDYRDYFSPDKERAGSMYSKWGGFIEEIDAFDPQFFNISPREARYMDPQERIFMETAWSCFEDAGYTRESMGRPEKSDWKKQVGVYVGVSFNNYQLFSHDEWQKGNLVPMTSQTFSVANRVSYFLDLGGPSLAVDTACSSSLVALHMACESIKNGESTMALAGGISLSMHPSEYITMCATRMLSTDGRCRVFGEGGDGMVPGEGSCALLLKPYAQAVRDHDNIYGVIKSTVVNNDGRTRGYSVPNPKAQSALIRQALQKADLDPRTISYIEAHGTGTALGDPIEIEGLSAAFSPYTEEMQFCSVGSVKSNIGHLEAAAGLAGVIKVLLQMKHEKRVPSLHAEELNRKIDFESTPFFVQRTLEQWKRPVMEEDGKQRACPLRAGVSSFGAGGVNAHVILEEHKEATGPGREEVIPTLISSLLSAMEVRETEVEGLSEPEAARDLLDSWSVHKLYLSFLQKGMLQEKDEQYTIDAFKARNRLTQTYDRLFDEVLRMFVQYGFITRDEQTIRCHNRDDRNAVMAKVERMERELENIVPLAPHVRLFNACVDGFHEIISGSITAQSVVFPDASMELVDGVYKNTRNATGATIAATVAHYLQERTRELKPGEIIKILEIGSGIGGTTLFILDAIKHYKATIQYTYTDVSRGFILHGEEHYGKRHEFMEFRILDIEDDIAGQGFPFNEYDLVIAANVFHATTNIAVTLAHTAQLMKPNGVLLLDESTSVLKWSTLTFGLLDGWWKYNDDEVRIPGSPLLNKQNWQQSLEQQGFRNVSFPFKDSLIHNLIMAEKRTETATKEDEPEQFLLTLSSMRKQGLVENVTRLVAYLESDQTQAVSLRDIAYTLQVGREPMRHRLACVVANRQEAIALLQSFIDDATASNRNDTLLYNEIVQENRVQNRSGGPENVQGKRLTAIARKWTEGSGMDWDSLYRGGQLPHKVSLPAYAFAREHYWIGERSGTARNTLEAVAVPPAAAVTEPHKKKQKKRKLTPVQQELVNAAASEHRWLLTRYIQAKVGEILEFTPPSLPETDLGFFAMGMDSVTAGTLCSEIAQALDVALPSNAPFDYPTIEELAGYVLSIIDLDELEQVDALPAEKETASMYETIYFKSEWCEIEKNQATRKLARGRQYLLFDADRNLFNEMKTMQSAIILVLPGKQYQQISSTAYEINPAHGDDYIQLFFDLAERHLLPDAVIHYWSKKVPAPEERAVRREIPVSMYSMFFLARALMTCCPEKAMGLLYLYSSGDEVVSPLHDAVWGFARTFVMEHAGISCKIAAIDERVTPSEIVDELEEQTDRVTSIKYLQGKRSKKVFREIDLRKFLVKGKETISLKEKGTYLITGGAGAIGLMMAEYLVQKVKARVVLSGRSPLSAGSKKILAHISREKGEVVYVQADVSRKSDMEKLITHIKKQYKHLHGILHAAGVVKDSLIMNTTQEIIDTVLRPKLYGVMNLDQATRNEPLDFFVLFSSTIAISGNPGQAAYAYANHFMDSYAYYREQLREQKERTGKTIVLNWSNWKEGGMPVSEQLLEALGFQALEKEDGYAAFELALHADVTQLCVMKADRSVMRKDLEILPPLTGDGQEESDVRNDVYAQTENVLQRIESEWFSQEAQAIASEIEAMRPEQVEETLEGILKKIGV